MSVPRVVSFGSVPPEWGGRARGGVATFHRALIAGLRTGLGTDAEIVGVVAPAATERREEMPVPCRVRAPGESPAQFLDAVLAEMCPDVAILQHFANVWGCLLPERAPGLPLVGVAHSWHKVTLAESPDERGKALHEIQSVMDDLDALVVGSEHARREGLSLGLRYPLATIVIPCPVPEDFTGPIDVEQPRAGVLFVGSLIQRKNAATLLDAVALMPDVTVSLVGEGPLEAALRAQAEASGLANRVRFPALHESDEHVPWLRDLMARSEILCVPSHSESFGIVYIEALACGTPVIGFGPTVREIAQAIGVEIGEPIEHATKESIAAAIERVRARTWDRPLLSHATLRAFNISEIARRYAGLLAQMASPRSSADPGGLASNRRAGRDVSADDRAGSHHGVAADLDTA